MLTSAAVLALLAGVLGLVYILTIPGRRAKTLPPGPPTLPVIGNIHQIPLKKTYIQFSKWAKQYGDIYSLKVASGTTVVISKRRLVKEIMDKQSSVSSSRPVAYAVDKLVYKGDFLLLMNSNDPRFRAGRKLFHQFFMESMVEKKHLPFINAEATQLMRDLLVDPANFMLHAKRYANSFIMSATYGIRTPDIQTPHFKQINHIGEHMTELVMPGALPPVDIFGFLHYVPERFLDHWKSRCLEMQKASDALYGHLMELVMERRRKRGPKETFADQIVDQQDKLGFSWHEMLYMTGVVLDAGTETTANVWIILVQMLTSRPELLRQVQEQIDAVVGEDRTPTWDDFPKLPIVNQLMKEVQRFRPVVPIAFPHRLTEAVQVDGYTLPKDTTIVVNLAGLHYDDAKFANAHDFDPNNYIGKPGLASEYANVADYELRDHYGYGFGRRLCPGIHLAERSLFVTFAKLLWGFDVGPAEDASGGLLVPDYDLVSGYTDGAVVVPQKFECSIKVRSEKRKSTILREFAEAERTIFSHFD